MTAIPPPVSETAAITVEQEARSILERLEYPDAQSLSSGDVIELANLIAEGHRLRAVNERLTKHVEWLRENARAMDWHGGLLRAEAIRAAKDMDLRRARELVAEADREEHPDADATIAELRTQLKRAYDACVSHHDAAFAKHFVGFCPVCARFGGQEFLVKTDRLIRGVT
jgi:hypothetical protein